jgi:hypothetical protein
VAPLLLALVLFAQTTNPWDGTWQWGTYEERQAWSVDWHAQIQALTREHCGQLYYAAC